MMICYDHEYNILIIFISPDIAEFMNDTKSAIVTGTGSWILYEDQLHLGNKCCAVASNEEMGVSEMYTTLSIERVGSIQKLNQEYTRGKCDLVPECDK